MAGAALGPTGIVRQYGLAGDVGDIDDDPAALAWSWLRIYVGSTWYARPYTPGGYGLSNGTSYANAFNGIRNINSITWSNIQPGDTLYVCGQHDGGGYDYTVGVHPQAMPVMFIAGYKSGTQARPLIVRGDYPGDPGVIFGTSLRYTSGWSLVSNGVYSRASPDDADQYPKWGHAFAQPQSSSGVDDLVHLANGDYTNLAAWTDGMYARDAVSDPGNPVVYFKPPTGYGTANDCTLYIAFGYPQFSVSSESWLVIKNVVCLGGNNSSWGGSLSLREGNSNLIVDGCTCKWSNDVAIGVGQDATGVEIRNCEISDSGLGVYFWGNIYDCAVRNCYLHDINQYGTWGVVDSDRHALALQGGGDGLVFENNIITDVVDGIVIYYDPLYCDDLLTNCVIRNNVITNCKGLTDAVWNQRGIEITGGRDAGSIADGDIHDNAVYGNTLTNIGNPAHDATITVGVGIRLKTFMHPTYGAQWSVYGNSVDNANVGVTWTHENTPDDGPGFEFTHNQISNSRTCHVKLGWYQNFTYNNDGAEYDYNEYTPDGATKFHYFDQFNTPSVTHNIVYSNFAAWQSATGKDANSVIV